MTEFLKKIDLLNAMARIQPSSENYSTDIAYWAARDMFDDILFQINAVTDAETEYIPVVHGHWIEELGNDISCRCSRCDHSYNLYEDDINGYPYCAWCGAKMKIDESEDNTNA